MLIDEDIDDIIRYGLDCSSVTKFKLILYHGTEETEITHIKNIAITSNFIENVSDVIRVECIYPQGDFVYDVLANRDELYMYMEVTYLKPDGTTETFNKLLSVFLDKKYTNSKTQEKRLIERDVLNKEIPMTIIFMCYDVSIAIIKKIQSEMSLKGVTLKQALEANFKNYVSEKEVVIDGENLEFDLEITEPHNTGRHERIQIEMGNNTDIDLTTLPFYLQEKYGIYNSGIISYMQHIGKPTIYVKPQINPAEYDKSEKKIDIFVSNVASKNKGVDKSYIDVEGVIKIITHDLDVSDDDGDERISQKGIAIIYRDSDTLRPKVNIDVDGNRVNNQGYGYKMQSMRNMDKSINKVKFVGNTDNPYNERTKLILNELRMSVVTWSNSCPFFILPGMPVRIHYERLNSDGEYEVKKMVGNVSMINTIFSFTDFLIHSNSKIFISTLDELDEEGVRI